MPPAATPLSSNRRDELSAAFQDEEDLLSSTTRVPPTDAPPGYHATASRRLLGRPDASSDVFFDAGDAMAEEPPHPVRLQGNVHDPLGASGFDHEGEEAEEILDDATHSFSLLNLPRPSRMSRNSSSQGGYDFERPSHFGANRSQSSSSAINAGHGSSAFYGTRADASTSRVALDPAAPATSLHGSRDAGAIPRVRHFLGRFGRFVGMRVPGAAYSSLSQEEAAAGGETRRRRVMGGGLGQDGVFANLNAKPETRRRRANNGGQDDRGEDDDLAEDILPPTYEVAAADAAPGYWETTIAPGGLGWTPGGGHVGDLEDLILEGLPIGNVFGFAWNLLVSMCFQFVGFLLTYLLHTTHAARCGSRAGLGITLIQYGFYLRTRALQLAEDGSDSESNINGGSNANEAGQEKTVDWFGNALIYTRPTQAAVRDGPTATSSASSPLATPLTSGGSSLPAASSSSDLTNNTSEWLAYALMIIGWLILLSSVLSYIRIYRWGRALIAASRREQESARAAESGGEAPELAEESAPVGFIHRVRAMMGPPQFRRDGRSTGTGEDWVIYPGAVAGAALGRSADPSPTTAQNGAGGTATPIWGDPPRTGSLAYPAVGMDEEQEGELGELREEREHLSPEEQRLVYDMRRVGLM